MTPVHPGPGRASALAVELLALAEGAARAAGEILLERWRGPATGVTTKSSHTDPASDADRAAEVAIVSRIHAARPDDAIVAEEGGATAGGSGIRWLIDPLDGTVNYLYGVPQWSVSIAALEGNEAVAGVVHDPVRDELFVASRGGGAWCGVERLSVSSETDLARVLLMTGFSYVAEERVVQARQQAQLVARVRDLRRFGSAALDLAWTAAGRADAYLETVANPWDWAAGVLLVREAGGQVSEVPGVRSGVPGLLASGPGVHEALFALAHAGA
ncbi:MAG: inositol monophosphatase [Chloroflexota bacterium]|nr:inositol monophosphatase [Chloroflexota bacterium]